MVYLFKAIGRDIQDRIDDEIREIIDRFDLCDESDAGTCEDGFYMYDWEIEALPGVTLEQAQTVFNALWRMTGEIDPDCEARLFEK